MPVNPSLQGPEMLDLLSWIGSPPRHPAQTHGLNESDSEVVDLGNGTYLAATVDTVSEEIEANLYEDPYRIGWVTAMASLSDLAAVGADPIGMLLSAEWSSSFGVERKAEVARGFSDALRRCGTYWLGGDSGRGRATVLGGVALGIVKSKPLSRMGMRPGDVLCMTGMLGAGPALAIRYLLGHSVESFPESHYLPVARLDAGRALLGLANAAMDTSDGLLSTLKTLSFLNGSELELEWSEELISAPARTFCANHGIPLWVLWEVEHGDYQLVVSIPEANLDAAKAAVSDLKVIGRVGASADKPGMRLRAVQNGIRQSWMIDPDLARTLLDAKGQSLTEALKGLILDARERNLP